MLQYSSTNPRRSQTSDRISDKSSSYWNRHRLRFAIQSLTRLLCPTVPSVCPTLHAQFKIMQIETGREMKLAVPSRVVWQALQEAIESNHRCERCLGVVSA